MIAIAPLLLYLLASLATFSPEDPGWSNSGSVTAPLHNVGGQVGALLADPAVDPEAVSQVGLEVRPPLHAGPGHPQAVENPGLHLLPDVDPKRFFEDQLGDVEALTGVAISSSRIIVKPELLVGLEPAEVGETGGVGEEMPHAQVAPAFVACQIAIILVFRQRPGEQRVEWCIEVQPTLIDKLHDQIGEGRLGERCAIHDGLGGERLAGGVPNAVGGNMNDLAVVDHCQCQPLDLFALHQRLRSAVDGGRVGQGSSVDSGGAPAQHGEWQ